jgi:prevent-host-death family protein
MTSLDTVNCMSDLVSSGDLRDRTEEVLRRVQSGERLRVTINQRPVAALIPLEGSSAWVARPRLVAGIVQADLGLRNELEEAFSVGCAGS